MTWQRMSMEEYAAFKRNGGDRVVKIKGTWWVEARPFFFRPLFPLSRVTPGLANYPVRSLVGGVLHLVPEQAPANSNMNLFLYQDLAGYALEGMDKKSRWVVRKSMENFRAERLTDVELFIAQAYPVYRSFYDRTKYFYKSERTAERFFAKWARTIFSNPKVKVTGAYRQDRLSAVDISYQVEDLIIEDVFFSDSMSQQLRVTDFMLHVLREQASRSDARMLFRGFPSGKESLDRAKMMRGCRLLALPAHCRMNPLALYLGKTLRNGSYRKLAAIIAAPQQDGKEE
uniref:Uncharacterized protein n=1 Tax=Geobacter sp. (strain M21) TaxID=443144 RepID=C6E248_GEOSM